MVRQIKSIQDVVDWGLCVGCGACHAACEKGGCELVSVDPVGIRPRFDPNACADCVGCLDVCPGYAVDATCVDDGESNSSNNLHELGSILEVWEGHASDPEIRRCASSGGALSALALFCLERGYFDSVLHTAMDKSEPWKNQTVVSTNRGELLERTGSRYAPSSPCEGLRERGECGKKFVFIGKPCDLAGVALVRRRFSEVDAALGLFFIFLLRRSSLHCRNFGSSSFS